MKIKYFVAYATKSLPNTRGQAYLAPTLKEKCSLNMPGDPSADVDFNDFINVPLIRAGRRLQLYFYKTALAPINMSIQEWRTLLNLQRLGDTHLRELARYGHLDPTHMSRAATALEKRGLIRRYSDPDDSRRKRMAITDEGAALVQKVWPVAQHMTQAVREEFGEARYDALTGALNKILEMDAFEPDAQSTGLPAE